MMRDGDVVGCSSDRVGKGASGQEIALRLYRGVMLLSIILILVNLA
jgi:hypothetical protein